MQEKEIVKAIQELTKAVEAIKKTLEAAQYKDRDGVFVRVTGEMNTYEMN